jgi:serine/threonine-protein kinase HipA
MKHITELNVFLAGEPVGILAVRDRQIWFQYNAHWLQHGFDLAPQILNFNNQPQLAKSPVFQGLHGVFYDSLPDGWGMLLMDRFFKREFSWDPHDIVTLDRLAYLGKRAMGALEYEPVIVDDHISEVVHLNVLLDDAERVLTGKSHAILKQLQILGGSPGGARPKVTIALKNNSKENNSKANDSNECLAGYATLPDGFSHWLVKFRGQDDPKDMGRIEKSYAELACRAGLEVPASRLIAVPHKHQRDEFFAVQRFDRIGSTKQHMLTLSGYLYADHRVPSLDYNALLAATAALTKDMREVRRAFRLMVFNIATHNKDDHAKNFAFISDRTGIWRLAPAYDLTFSQGMNNEHTTAINGAGHPAYKDIVAIAKAHGITDYENIVLEVFTAAAKWKEVAKNYRVKKSTIKKISDALDAIAQRIYIKN